MKFNAAAAQCCIYAVKDKRIREMRNGMNTIEKNINVIEISDISAPELDVFARMTETQLRSKLEPEKGIFIAESPTVIRIALDAGYEPLSLLVEKKHVAGQAADIIERTAGIPVYTAETQLLSKLTGYPLTRGVFCAMRRKPPLSAESVCGGASRIAVLDGIVDSTNIGAIFRSAAALGMDAVLLSPHLLRSALQACNKGQHGHGVSDSVGKIAAGRGREPIRTVESTRVQACCNGA